MTVREVTGPERDRIYAEQARRYPGFGEHERQTAGIRTIPVLELRRAWPTLLRLAGEILVTFEEYTRHVDWPLTVLSASFVLRAR